MTPMRKPILRTFALRRAGLGGRACRDPRSGETACSTGQAVDPVEAIAATIRHLSAISVSVSSAVTEQAAVTRDMSANMHVAARGVETVRRTVDGIAEAAGDVDRSVQKVSSAARALA